MAIYFVKCWKTIQIILPTYNKDFKKVQGKVFTEIEGNGEIHISKSLYGFVSSVSGEEKNDFRISICLRNKLPNFKEGKMDNWEKEFAKAEEDYRIELLSAGMSREEVENYLEKEEIKIDKFLTIKEAENIIK